MTQAWPLLSSQTLTDQVYQVLRDRILAGSWDAGSFIREQEISDKLGVSRTPVREALGRLASERFLERIPHRGFRIPEQTATDLLDLYPILASLEVLAARQSFAELDGAGLEALRRTNLEYEKAWKKADIRAGIELNNQFHHQLSELCGNRRLCDMLDELRSEVMRLEIWAFSSFSMWETSIREHDEILDAVERQDFPHALATLEANRLMTYTDFVARMGPSDGDGHGEGMASPGSSDDLAIEQLSTDDSD